MVRKDIQLRQTEEQSKAPHRLLRHPFFAWLGVRPVWGQHTLVEQRTLRKWACGKSRLVEIGVAEGGSAAVIRDAMSPTGTLWLIDPFHLSRFRSINATKRAAHRIVGNCRNGSVVWVEQFSFDAVLDWNQQIDFLLLDGDHTLGAVKRDWEDWHSLVVPGGVIVFHDAAVFPGGWTQPDWGPVELVDQLFREQTVVGWQIVEEVDSLVVVQRLSSVG